MSIEEKAWRVFSRYVRLSNANAFGYCKCVTCERVKRWQDMDCGHWIDRRFKSVMVDVRNTAPQCRVCNRYQDGQSGRFEQRIRFKYGSEAIEELLYLRDHGQAPNWASVHEKYKKLLKEEKRKRK